MKILQVIPFFSPKCGGSVTILCNLSRELVKSGHDVTIVTSDYGFDSDFAAKIEKPGLKVIPFRTLFHFGLFIITPSLKKWLEINCQKFQVIHLHEFRSYQNNCILDSVLRNNQPYVIQAHGSVLPLFDKFFFKKLYDYIWGYRLLSNASRLIAVSKAEYNQYLTMGVSENKINIIPNGIDISIFNEFPENGFFRRINGINPDEKIILYLGRIHKRKYIDVIINGFYLLIKRYPHTKLMIIGPDDGFLNILKKQVIKLNIPEKVYFKDFISETEKFSAFFDSDIVVYPGIHEIFGIVPFEAIMACTPVIVADDSGCGELIKEIGCGYLVKPGDVEDLKNKMQHILENPSECRQLVDRGQNYIRQQLCWSQNIKKFEQLYANIIYNK